jgi:tetratricopeptide (TPR) repeat protein
MNRAGLILACICIVGAVSPAFADSRSSRPGASGSSIAAEADQLTLFTEANKRYNDEDYRAAAEGYARIILSGLRNGEMYYNLGNSYFKLGMLGKAILSYRLAERYLPRDQDLTTNLAYAREMTRDKIESRQLTSFFNEFCFWYSKLNLKELLLVFLMANALCWALALARLWLNKDYWRYLFLAVLLLTVVLALSLGIKVYHSSFSADAVVITRDVAVRAGIGSSNTALFQLHDGVECRIIQQEQDWVKLELADGKRGWVESRWLGRCRPQSWPVPPE